MSDPSRLDHFPSSERTEARHRGCLFLLFLMGAMAYSAVVGAMLANGVGTSSPAEEVLFGGAVLIAMAVGVYLAVSLDPSEGASSDWHVVTAVLCTVPVVAMMAVAGGVSYLVF